MGGEGREGENGSGDDGERRDGRQGGAGGGGMGHPMASAAGVGASGGGCGWRRRAEAGGGGEGMAAPGNGRSWIQALADRCRCVGRRRGRPQPQRRQPTAGRREIQKPPVHERWPPNRRARLDGPPRLVEGAQPPHLVRFQMSSDHTLLSSPVTPPRAYACAPPTRPAPSHPRLKLFTRASLHTLPPLTPSRFVLPSLPPLSCRRRLWPVGPRHGLCPRRCRRRPPLAAATPRTRRGLPPPPALEDDGRGAAPLLLLPGARCASIGGSGGRSGSSGGGTAGGDDDRSPCHPSHLVHPSPPRRAAHIRPRRRRPCLPLCPRRWRRR